MPQSPASIENADDEGDLLYVPWVLRIGDAAAVFLDDRIGLVGEDGVFQMCTGMGN